MKNTFTENTTVICKKNGNGVIKEILTKSTGYAVIAFENGTEKKLVKKYANLAYSDGTPCFGGKKATKKEVTTVEVTPLQRLKNQMLWVNGMTYKEKRESNLSFKIWDDALNLIELKAKEMGNDFIASICEGVYKYKKASEKQAFCIARFAVENNVQF